LNISQYKLLCKVCDNILEKNKSIYRAVIPLLHVIREHPFVVKQYQSIFRGNSETSCKIPNDNSFFSRLYKRISSAVTFERLSFENIKRYCKEYFTQLDSSILFREIEDIKN